MGILKNEIMRTYNMRPSTAERCMEILEVIDSISKTEYERGFADAEPQWIPCSERLPEDDDYRPCYGYEDGAVWWINDIGQMGLGWYYTSTRTWAYYDEISASEEHVGNVIAWMPIPEPWKGEQE